eukprot:4344662-Amphidinium_carterae.1
MPWHVRQRRVCGPRKLRVLLGLPALAHVPLRDETSPHMDRSMNYQLASPKHELSASISHCPDRTS